MARKPMVTRTIVTTKATALCLNITTGEPENITVTVPRTYKDEAKLLKAVQAVAETDELKVVHIVATEEVETLYGMTEQDFILGAIVLPPRGTKEESDEED